MEIFKLAESPQNTFDLVKDSTAMEHLVLQSTLLQVSKGMQELASTCFPIHKPAKFPIVQWATLFAHLGFVSFLKELEARRHKHTVWTYLVARAAGQTEAMEYLATKINVDTALQHNGWIKEVNIVVDQTGKPKWECFVAYCAHGADIVSAILDLC